MVTFHSYVSLAEGTQEKHRPLHSPLEDELLLKLTPALLDLPSRPANIARLENLDQHKLGKKYKMQGFL